MCSSQEGRQSLDQAHVIPLATDSLLLRGSHDQSSLKALKRYSTICCCITAYTM